MSAADAARPPRRARPGPAPGCRPPSTAPRRPGTRHPSPRACRRPSRSITRAWISVLPGPARDAGDDGAQQPIAGVRVAPAGAGNSAVARQDIQLLLLRVGTAHALGRPHLIGAVQAAGVSQQLRDGDALGIGQLRRVGQPTRKRIRQAQPASSASCRTTAAMACLPALAQAYNGSAEPCAPLQLPCPGKATAALIEEAGKRETARSNAPCSRPDKVGPARLAGWRGQARFPA